MDRSTKLPSHSAKALTDSIGRLVDLIASPEDYPQEERQEVISLLYEKD